MKTGFMTLSVLIGITVSAAGLVGCAGGVQVKDDGDSAKASTTSRSEKNNEFYQVYSEDGRIYMFDDQKTYLEYLSVGETSFRLTRIGAGPNGETVVFGLTKANKKKRSGIPVVDMHEGRLAGGQPFYGEIVKHGRYFVFSSWDDMQQVRSVGEPTFMYTDIGAGPGGNTVVYVLNKSNKKKKPEDLIATFHSVHGV
jgi:hypothetical protein